MLLAAIALAMTLYPDECPEEVATQAVEVPVQEEIKPKEEPIVIATVRSPIIPKQERKKPITNLEPGPTPKDYERQNAAIPPLITPSTTPVGEVFMYEVLHRPHIRRIRFDEFEATTLKPGSIVAYIWIQTTPAEKILQYAVIGTEYGNVYVTCEIDSEGVILQPNGPLDIYYDNVALSQMVSVAAESNSHRFPTNVKFDKDHIRSMDDLNFLFGNPMSAKESYNVSYLL